MSLMFAVALALCGCAEEEWVIEPPEDAGEPDAWVDREFAATWTLIAGSAGSDVTHYTRAAWRSGLFEFSGAGEGFGISAFVVTAENCVFMLQDVDMQTTPWYLIKTTTICPDANPAAEFEVTDRNFPGMPKSRWRVELAQK
jgi:hypothetical protein